VKLNLQHGSLIEVGEKLTSSSAAALSRAVHKKCKSAYLPRTTAHLLPIDICVTELSVGLHTANVTVTLQLQ
jgi:hypothetical protein